MSRRSTRLTVNKEEAAVAAAPQPSKPTKTTAKKATSTTKTSKKRKETSEVPEETAPEVNAESTAPATPVTKRRRTTKNEKPQATTTTPSKAKSKAEGTKDANGSSPAVPRPADPHATNAALKTPKGSKLTAYSNTTPVKWTGLPKPTTTTETLLEEGCKHLIKIEPRLKPIIEQHPCHVFSPEGLKEVIDPYRALCSSIIGQQVSGAAAGAIRNKFISLYPTENRTKDTFPTAEEVAKTSIEKLRTAGLSQRKAEYIQGLSEKFAAGELTAKMLVAATDDEVMEKLIAVRGLGKWSVEMFACFSLKRMDVFSTGDLGVQRGMAALVGKDVAKLKNKGGKWKYMSEQEMLDMSAKFAPYRSLFMWYMWRVEETNTEILDNM